MTPLRATSIVIGVLNALINIIKMITTEEEKLPYFNAFCGWTCAILYMIE